MKTGFNILCKFCKKEFYVSKCNLYRSKYCSRTCYDQCPENKRGGRGKFTGKIIPCGFCKKELKLSVSRIAQNKLEIVYCSHSCKGKAMQEGKAGYGFKKLENPKKQKKYNHYIVKQIQGIRKYEHRRVVEKHLGRDLEKWEHIHHINGDPKDNRLENLMIANNILHGKIEFQSNDRIYH